jgi:hypothetical protein
MARFFQLGSLNTSEDSVQSSVSTRVFQPKEQELHHTSENLVDNIYNFPYMVGKEWNIKSLLFCFFESKNSQRGNTSICTSQQI